VTSKSKGQGHEAALGGCSRHLLHGAGAYCGGRTTGRTAC